MNNALPSLNSNLTPARRIRSLLVPVLAAAMIFVVLVPLPPMIMSILLVANITLAAVIFLTTIFITTPLEFSVFPSLLLGATMFRLVLNIATTRLILTAGENGRSIAEAQHAAGDVVWTFSQFVAAGSLPVGVILFSILAVIQFVVITKGASRISEVAARFVLDAMPGKQMAIDADLNAGIIEQDEARRRRGDITSRADFYGAMDGASKFLRGDAVAAVLITLVNICGGLYVGMAQYGWGWGQTVGLFTRLTIGDGLVTQVPALLITISAALMVTRSTGKTSLGDQIIGQLTARPIALVVTAVFLLALTLTALPAVPLAVLAAGCLATAWWLKRRGEQTPQDAKPADANTTQHDEIQRIMTVQPMQIELGYALIRLADSEQGGDLLERISNLRSRVAGQLGLVIPRVAIRDNMQLRSHNYSIGIRGATVATGRIQPGRLFATGPEEKLGGLAGPAGLCPTTDEPGVWIRRDDCPKAQEMGLTIITPVEMILSHLTQTVRRHAAELLTRQKAAEMLEDLRSSAGSLVDEVTAKCSIGHVQRIFQRLLAERVSIRDTEAVLEALCEAAERTDQLSRQVEAIRKSMGRTISQSCCSEYGRLWCVTISDELAAAVAGEGELDSPGVLPFEGDLHEQIVQAIGQGVRQLRQMGQMPVLLCKAGVRVGLRRIIAASMPEAAVLSYDEIDSVEVKSIEQISLPRPVAEPA
ncbi:MAG: flagellar biosynthesis protein FlhA [Phycisphaerae bacterium]|nr:flagellar biosynthesis protein FlhA [Phycisphaerae bacterium]